jgi:Domain of unknown function (DUF5667)
MKDIKHLKKALEGIKLTAEEKQQGYAALLKVMGNNPIESPSFWSRVLALSTWPRRLSAATLLLVLCTGSFSYAAESSAPGDLFYPIKVHVNEQIVTAVQFTPKARVRWRVAQVERRLEEVEMLQEQGRFNEPVKQQIQQQIKVHAQDMQNQVQMIQQFPVQVSNQIKMDLNQMVQNHPEAAEEINFYVQADTMNTEGAAGLEESNIGEGLVDGSAGLVPEIHGVIEIAPEFSEAQTFLQIDGETFELDL